MTAAQPVEQPLAGTAPAAVMATVITVVSVAALIAGTGGTVYTAAVVAVFLLAVPGFVAVLAVPAVRQHGGGVVGIGTGFRPSRRAGAAPRPQAGGERPEAPPKAATAGPGLVLMPYHAAPEHGGEAGR